MELNKDQLIGLYENVYDYEDQAKALKSQAKVILDRKKEELEEFAKDVGTEKKNIMRGYQHYKELRSGTSDADDEDFYTVLVAIDQEFAKDNDTN